MKFLSEYTHKNDFAHFFMTSYRSPGRNIPMTSNAYGNTFELTELRSSYKVTIRGLTKRFNNLLSVAEFIYQKTCINPITYPPRIPKDFISNKYRIGQTNYNY